MAAFASPSDIAEAWRPLTVDEDLVALTLSEYASAMIRSRFSTVDQRVTDGDLDESLPRLATIQMVQRVLENPNVGVRHKAFGEAAITYVPQMIGLLEITPLEVQLLTPKPSTAPKSIRVTPGLW